MRSLLAGPRGDELAGHAEPGSGGAVVQEPAAKRVLLATAAMGTRFELVLAGPDETGLRSAGEEALREIEAWHDRLSRFIPHSDIARLNRDPAARVHPETRDLLELCERLRYQTGGAFDIAVGSAMVGCGLHPEGTGRIDLGAIGKGFALDRAASLLRRCGVASALLHGGTSSIVAIGVHAVAVRSGAELLPVTLRDRSMAVSSATERLHILDPRTGRPVAGAPRTTVVIGPSGAICDAWSTALLVLGRPPGTFPAGYEFHVHDGCAG